MEIAVDEAQWPLVRVTYPPEITFRDIRILAEHLAAIHRARGPMALVADISALCADSVTPLLRQRVAEEADKLAEQGAFLVEAVIVSDPVLRGLHRAYTWARKKQNYPNGTFANLRAATSWARAQASQDE